MKKFLLCALASVAAMSASAYTTRGNGETYTFSSLAQIEGSGVTVEDGAIVISDNVQIAMGDALDIEGGLTIKMKSGFQVEILGSANLQAPADNRVLITRYDESATPKGIYLNSDEAEINVANIDFDYAQLRNFGTKGSAIDNCTFTNSLDKLNTQGALSYGKCEWIKITNCKFSDTKRVAIGGGYESTYSYTTQLTIEDCEFTNCDWDNRMGAVINVAPGGEKDVVIRNCKIVGPNKTKVGAVSVYNVGSFVGENNVLIEGCDLSNSRYGINIQGNVSAVINNNKIHDNTINGGNGISISSGFAIISNNKIYNNSMGVVIYNVGNANLGQVDTANSPGGNEFANNINITTEETLEGTVEIKTPVDLMLGNSNVIYAQNNVWGVEEQTEENISKVISISEPAEGEEKGQVIYMPAGTPAPTVDYYLIGGFNSWKSADPNAKFEAQADGTYVLNYVGTLTSGFKINDGDPNWGGVNIGSDGVTSLVVGEPFVYVNGADAKDITMASNVKNPTITLNPEAGTILMEGEAVVAQFVYKLHGDWQGEGSWSDIAMTETEGVWSAQVTVPATIGFGIKKVDAATNSQTAWISADGNGIITAAGDYACKIEGTNFSLAPGTWTLALNPETMVLTVSDDAGVDGVEIDNSNAPVEYFNLQGVKVADPTEGLYIVRRGNTVTKQVIR